MMVDVTQSDLFHGKARRVLQNFAPWKPTHRRLK